MLKQVRTLMTAGVPAGAVAASASVASAGTPPFFVPLTESAPVTAANSDEEMNQPWITPANITQENLTSMDEIEGDIGQSVVRVPGVGRSASMWDMVAFDPDYPTKPLSHFEPLIREIFSREPFDPEVIEGRAA